MLKPGTVAPRFAALNQDGREIRLEDFLGRNIVVLYFFPKDSTPGWTAEARGFRELHTEFEKKDAVIFGVSVDDARAHQRFRERESLPFDLLVDKDQRLCRLFEVNVTNLFVFKLIERVTYVIGKDGVIKEAFERVKPQGHAAAVLCTIGAGPG